MTEHPLFTYDTRVLRGKEPLSTLPPGTQLLLREWATYLMKLWLTSPDFRPKASSERIYRSIKHRLSDEFLDLYIGREQVIINLLCDFGFGRKYASSKTSGLINQLGRYATTHRMMLEFCFETFLNDIIEQDNPELLNPELFVGRDQKTVAEELGLPPRIVKRLFAKLVATGRFKVAMKRVAGRTSPVRALVEVV